MHVYVCTHTHTQTHIHTHNHTHTPHTYTRTHTYHSPCSKVVYNFEKRRTICVNKGTQLTNHAVLNKEHKEFKGGSGSRRGSR